MKYRPTPLRMGSLTSIMVLGLISGLLAVASPATAQTGCPGEESIFWGYSFAGAFRYEYGTKSDIQVTDRALNVAGCGINRSFTAATSHIVWDDSSGSLFEAGIQNWVNSLGVKEYHWFVEGLSFGSLIENPIPHQKLSSKCPNVAVGQYIKFKVAAFPVGTTDWEADLQCSGSSTWQNLRSYSGTGWYTGWSEVETSRMGGTATGMADDHINIQRKDSGNHWLNWSEMSCDFDTATNWNGTEVSTYHYKTVKSTAIYCPQP